MNVQILFIAAAVVILGLHYTKITRQMAEVLVPKLKPMIKKGRDPFLWTVAPRIFVIFAYFILSDFMPVLPFGMVGNVLFICIFVVLGQALFVVAEAASIIFAEYKDEE